MPGFALKAGGCAGGESTPGGVHGRTLPPPRDAGRRDRVEGCGRGCAYGDAPPPAIVTDATMAAKAASAAATSDPARQATKAIQPEASSPV